MSGEERQSHSEANSELVFEKSKNGEETCSYGMKYLHSRYNPRAEGEKFALNLEADFSPLCIFILEPALSYCAPYLKVRFPSAEIFAIRFTDFFSKTDSLWDGVFYLNSHFPLSEQLFNSISEEKLCSSLVFDWTPSKQIFQSENIMAWCEIKKAILKARDVIGTRAYFSKRWLKNTLIFSSRLCQTLTLTKGSEAIIVAASGPSLKSSLPYIKRFRESFFLIALSSAYMPLVKNAIIPDIVISSDGGWWAKKHLLFSHSADNIVYALEAEAAVPKELFEKHKIIPLCYPDGLEKDFLNAIKAPYMLSERNGTVAGTALQFALSLTDGSVYLCGLDQAAGLAFQHIQPNALENDNAKKDFRLRPQESRISASRFNSEGSLEIYRNWFVSNSSYFSNRTFRLSDNVNYPYDLGEIRECNWLDFEKKESGSKKKKISFCTRPPMPTENRKEILFEKLRALAESEHFEKEVFPMDSLLIQRESSKEKKAELVSRLAEKKAALLEECEKLL